MSSPPRTRRFFRPLLEDIRRIAVEWKRRWPVVLIAIAVGEDYPSGRPETVSKHSARRRAFRNTALSFAAAFSCLILAFALPGASTIGCTIAAFCFYVVGCISLTECPARSGWSRPANSAARRRVETPSKRLGLVFSVALLTEFACSLALSAFLFARAYDTNPAVMFLSIAGAVASFSVAICCGVLWVRLLGWWRRVPDTDVPAKTTEGTRFRSRAVYRHLLEDIHRTAATR